MKGQTTEWHDARWLGFFALILVGWSFMFAMSTPDKPELFGSAWTEILAELCSVTTRPDNFFSVYAMWGLMAAAMMAPSFTPALKTYDDLIHAGAGTSSGFVLLLSGYLLVWLTYALAGALGQLFLSNLGLLTSSGISSSLWLNAGLLLIAGLFQFTQLKETCLSRCRSPMSFYMAHWRDGTGGALYMGLRLGAVCAGCCWALMLLAFVGGTMNLMWMGVAMVLMTLEKLPQLGRYLTRPLGYSLLMASAVTTGYAIALSI